MLRPSNHIRPFFIIFLAMTIVGWMNLPGRAAPQKSPFKVGDKVEIEWAGETVQGEVANIQPVSGWVQVRCKINGLDMSPVLPPERLAPIKKKAPAAAVKNKQAKSAKEDSENEDSEKTAPSSAGATRTWTDVSGKHAIEAEFVELKGGKVTLKKEDGSTVTLPLKELSPADRREAQKLAAHSADENPFESGKKAGGAKDKASDDSSDEKPAAAGDWSDVRQVMIDPSPSGKIVPDAQTGGPLGKLSPFTYVAQDAASQRNPRHRAIGGIFFDRQHQQAVLSLQDHFGEVGPQLDCCNLKTGKLLYSTTLDTAADPVDLSPDGSLAVCMPSRMAGHRGQDRGLEIWKLQKKSALISHWKPDRAGDFFPSSAEHAWFISSEQVLTCDAWNDNLTLWNIQGAKAVYTLKIQKRCLPGLSPNRKQLALMTEAGAVVLDAASGATLALLPCEPAFGAAFAFRADGRQLACLSPNELRIWDLEKNALLREVWLARQISAKRLDWIDDDHLLASGSFLIDVPKRIVLWEYRPRGTGAAAALDGKLCYALAESSLRQKNPGTQIGVFFVPLPHPEALAVAKGLTDEKLLAIKPGIEVGLEIRVPGNPEEIQKITERITASLQENGIKVVPGAPIALEAVVEQGKTQTETYHNMMGLDRNTQTVSVTEQISRLSFKENGQPLWERQSSTGGYAPAVVTHQKDESVQQAIDKRQGSPLYFFLHVSLPKYVARPGEKGAYGASQLTPQGLAPLTDK